MTNWVRDAAEEIWCGHLCGYLSRDQLVEVIEKHCPFKMNVAYQEVTGEDYLKPDDGRWAEQNSPSELRLLPVTEDQNTPISITAWPMTQVMLLPAIPGHAHTLSSDGQPTCGCVFVKKEI